MLEPSASRHAPPEGKSIPTGLCIENIFNFIYITNPRGDLKMDIIEDYLIWSGIQSDKTPKEIECEFYGIHGESVAVYFHTSGAYETPIEEEIAGFKFVYPDSRVIRIWNNGEFYKMPEAYDNGLITDESIKNIHQVFRKIKFTEPYFIYQEKSCNIPPADTPGLRAGRIYVGLDSGISREDKVWNFDFLGNIDYETIDVGWYDYRKSQNFVIYLKDKTPEVTVEVAKKLYEIDGIRRIEVETPGFIDTVPNDYVSENDEEQGQWNIPHINLPEIWDFTTEN